MSPLKITECPRDAMQGIKEFIPTQTKADYLNALLKCGFDVLDFGSFVSPKAIPQMQDTREVLGKLDLSGKRTKLLAIIANERGADEAAGLEEISYLGFPFSISETFQQRNANSSIAEAFEKVTYIQDLCQKSGKQLVVYLSMGFGNPYGDPWSPDIVIQWSEKLYRELGISILALSDTVGSSTPELVSGLFSALIPNLPQVEFGAHLHTRPEKAMALIESAYAAGCRRFDGAIKGFGGCPMAKDDLTGNMPTEKILAFMETKGIENRIDRLAFEVAYHQTASVFPLKH